MSKRSRMRYWLFVIKPRLGVKEEEILPWHAMVLKMMLFSIDGMRWLLMSKYYGIKWRTICSPPEKLLREEQA